MSHPNRFPFFLGAAVAGWQHSRIAHVPTPSRRTLGALTRVDRRTALGKRIAELKALYISACGGADALSPVKRLRIDEAAQLEALAASRRLRSVLSAAEQVAVSVA